MRRHLTAAATLLLAGCTTVVPVGRSVDVDPETAPSCARICRQVGMRVGAIVFIRNMGGCVCEPEAPAPRADAGGGAAALGGAVVVLLEEERRQQEELQQQQQQQQAGAQSVGGASPGHR